MTAAKPRPQPTTDPRELRERVVLHIAQHPDNTADQISAAVRATKTQVINTLNALRTEGLIDATRGGKPPAQRYHAAVTADELLSAATAAPADALDMPSGIKPGTRKAQIWHTLRGSRRLTAREITTALHCPAGTCDPTISELMRTGILARSKNGSGVYMYHHPAQPPHPKAQPAVAQNTGSDGAARTLPPAETVAPSPAAPVAADDTDDDNATPAPDPALLASANRMLCERLEGVAHALRGCGLPKLRGVTGSDNLQQAVAALSGAHAMLLAEHAWLTDEYNAARIQNDIHDHDLARAAKTLAAVAGSDMDTTDMDLPELAQLIANQVRAYRMRPLAQAATPTEEAPIAADDTATPTQHPGYIVTFGEPAIVKHAPDLDTACEVACGHVQRGAARADVYALMPVGTVRRSAVWIAA